MSVYYLPLSDINAAVTENVFIFGNSTVLWYKITLKYSVCTWKNHHCFTCPFFAWFWFLEDSQSHSCLSWRHCPGLIPLLLGMESVYFWWFPSTMPCFAIRAVFIQVNGLFDRRTDGCGVWREMDRWSLQNDELFVLERKYLPNNNLGLISMKPLSIFLWPNICHKIPGGAPYFNSVLEHCSLGQLGIWIAV